MEEVWKGQKLEGQNEANETGAGKNTESEDADIFERYVEESGKGELGRDKGEGREKDNSKEGESNGTGGKVYGG